MCSVYLCDQCTDLQQSCRVLVVFVDLVLVHCSMDPYALTRVNRVCHFDDQIIRPDQSLSDARHAACETCDTTHNFDPNKPRFEVQEANIIGRQGQFVPADQNTSFHMVFPTASEVSFIFVNEEDKPVMRYLILVAQHLSSSPTSSAVDL